MDVADFQIEDGPDGGARLRLTGDWTTMGLARTARRLSDDLGDRPVAELALDQLGRFDTAGALAIVQNLSQPLPKTVWRERPEAGRIYAMVEKLDRESSAPPKRAGAFTRTFAKIGLGVYDFAAEAVLSLAFLGRLIVAVGSALKHPGAIRWPAWFSQAERSGLDAIPIIAVTNFFIGAVIAFLGANLLTQFGAGVFTVQLVAVSVLREFAVVITSVLLAGRSASSFAAEIGSMRMNQEVDAMQVMGVNPFQALVIPRLAAMLLMLPLLTFVGMVSGLFGGMLVTWSELAYGPSFFIQRITEDPMMDQHLMVGLIKAPVFAVVVAAIGCRQGMSVAGDVESLGRRVTAAVVQAIFAIIFLDAVFAMIFLELNL
ncbi:phospholipid/cholesterol/gamma-HCH transport system permease protein [Brevundimonas bullata]|uniref:Phospholipid/cholesterol/gamma-HCH transport system permease protein n=1 Tax=Brevundimonas bullata TaxID=13160 RepID=A0A7W7IRS9_9CAUL|nr:ABC transporter permease [Brevundimonas bullata]MBB4798840.1 phospholipid/cholesterol/gamma-HCH transport system permease protein [Brevundimonas bullata]MBB6383800.1 phospholipid/cholesterol/gamma-HCH transport system permease protein [Brevundimonas bullata]